LDVGNKNYSFELFTKSQCPELYKEYRRIKYTVFVLELGWFSLPHASENGMADENDFDRRAVFVLAKDSRDRPAGTARGILIHGSFPHEVLFTHHLSTPELAPLKDHLATINAVAVLKEHRGKLARIDYLAPVVSVGKAIMMKLIGRLIELGAKVIFVSTNPDREADFFLDLGFYIIDEPFTYDVSPTRLINMALLVNDSDRFSEVNSPLVSTCAFQIPLDAIEKQARAYLRRMHQMTALKRFNRT
jgi:hypothetical protein